MKNADVIRQMTDDELYKFLQAIEIGDIDYSLTFCSLCKEDAQLDCDECFKRWLFGDADDYNGLLKDKGINSGYKTENSSEKPNNSTSSKMEQVDEPQTCDTCKYGEDKHRYAHICNECGVGINNYEPKDEPQVDDLIRQADEMIKFDEELLQMDEPQTDCQWK